MSFWDNNKGTFLAAGKATAKGIGSGTKALGKAGYRTYKKNQAERKGLPPGETENGDGSSYSSGSNLNTSADSTANAGYSTGTHSGTSHYLSSSKADLSALPLPPKRLVGPGEVRPLNSQAVQSPQSQLVQQLQQLQPQPQPLPGARPVPQPPQNQNGQIQQSYPAQAQQPAYGVDQHQQQYQAQHQQQVQQPVYQPQPQQTVPQLQFQQPIYQPQPQTSYQPVIEQENTNQPPPAYNENNFQNNQPEPELNQPIAKKPLPDPSLFVPPPIHKNRGLSEQSNSKSQKKTDINHAPAGKYGNSSTFRNTSFDIDPSKVGPPPPKPYRENSGTAPTSASLNIRQTPPLPTRQSGSSIQTLHTSNAQSQATAIPPPPPRSNTTSVNSESSHLSKTDSFLAPLPPRDNVALDIAKKKAPPPKPTKKPSYLSSDVSLRAIEVNSLSEDTQPHIPNFAEEIASRKTTTNNGLGSQSTLNSESVNLELKNKLRPVNSESYAEREAPIDTHSIIKTKPTLAPKSKVGLKPEISPKPAALNLPETKSNSKPEIKAKPEIKTKPEIKAKPVIGSKPVMAPHSKSPDVISNTTTDLSGSKSSVPVPPIPRPRSAASNTPPQPVPRPRSATSNSSTPPPPPPPSRNYRRTKAVTPPIELGPPNFDLQLSTGWFANISGPMELPKDLSGLNYNTSYLYTAHGSDKSYTRNINLRLRDLAILSYAITWLNDNIDNAKVEVTKFVPSPILNKIPTVDELIANQRQFGEYVASWSENKIGQKVGSGECWDVAHNALLKGCGNHAFVSTYHHHGFPILLLQGSENGVSYVRGQPILDELRRGDILQYTSCIFKDKNIGSVSTVGNPDHTSVILENMGDKLIIAEQNINNVKIVQKREVCLQNLTQGIVVGYRPMPTQWAGNL